MDDNWKVGPGASIVGKRKHIHIEQFISASSDGISNLLSVLNLMSVIPTVFTIFGEFRTAISIQKYFLIPGESFYANKKGHRHKIGYVQVCRYKYIKF